MRQFLYITPYFPPQSRVGALRPLKFVRHLHRLGWRAVVLCDLGAGDAVDGALLEALPDSTVVIRDYGWRSQAASRAYFAGRSRGANPEHRSALPIPRAARRLAVRVDELLGRNPELVPLGEHSVDMPHATAAARRTLARHPCEAVVVNADPYAALLVGRSVAREHGLPLIADLRDPWALCELRRPLRPRLQSYLVDRLERQVVSAARAVVLNTETTRAHYVEHYRDLDEERFVTIRNHADADLIDAEAEPPRPYFTLLFLGHLRRFVEGQTLLTMLADLRSRGYGPESVCLRVVGTVPAATRDAAQQLGVSDQLVHDPAVPYRRIGGVMKSADLLVAVSHAGQQRIPAKIYDYLTVPRPLLVLSDNVELAQLLDRAGGAHVCGLGDASGAADRVLSAMAAGRRSVVDRRDIGTDSATAAARLDELMRRSGSASF